MIITSILGWIIDKVQSIFDFIFGDLNFSVLYSWLPSDIQTAFALFIIILFCLAIWRFIRSFLPF